MSGNYDDRLDGGIQPYLYEPMEDTISNGSNDNDRSEENLDIGGVRVRNTRVKFSLMDVVIKFTLN